MNKSQRIESLKRVHECRLYTYWLRSGIEAFIKRARDNGGTEAAIKRAIHRMTEKAIAASGEGV